MLVALLFANCEKEEKEFEGTAKFSIANTENLYVGEELTFQNNSTEAGHYLWDFGDNNTSTEKSPKHTYIEVGTYDITLILSEAELEDYNADGIINRLDCEFRNASIADTTINITEKPTSFPKVLNSKIESISENKFFINGSVSNENFEFNDLFSNRRLGEVDSIEFVSESIVKFYGVEDAPSFDINYSFENNKLNLISLPDYPEISVDEFNFSEMIGNHQKLISNFTILYYYGYRFDEENTKVDLNMDGLINDSDKMRGVSEIPDSLSYQEVFDYLSLNQELMGENDTLLIFNFKQILE